MDEHDQSSLPAVTISAVELAALRDPAVVAAIAEAKAGNRTKLRQRPAPGRHQTEG